MVVNLGTLGTGAGGLLSIGGGIYGAITGSRDAKDIANIQRQMMATEQKENDIRENAMFVESNRQSMQNVRQAQYARAMAVNTATGQGAQFGSVLGGAIGSISGQANTNQLGISQNLQFGKQMFDTQRELTGEKMELAKAQGDAAGDAAFSKMLGGIGGSLGDLGKIGQSLPGILGMFAV